MDHQAFAQLLGNYGEFVGAIAVVITLVYLAIQVRHSRAATEANTRQLESTTLREMAGRMESRTLLLATDSGLADRLVRQNLDPDSLSELDRFHLFWYVISWIADYEEAYRQYTLGSIPESALAARTINMQGLLESNEAKEAWSLALTQLDPKFVVWVKSKLDL